MNLNAVEIDLSGFPTLTLWNQWGLALSMSVVISNTSRLLPASTLYRAIVKIQGIRCTHQGLAFSQFVPT